MNKFSFHNVGQGLFYTGSLRHGTYNFVFDCGTNSKQEYLNNQISDYVREFNCKKGKKPCIKFVVISHLHNDHFSGLKQLLDQTNVRKVYLPYLGKGNKYLRQLLIAYAVIRPIIDNTANQRLDNELEVGLETYRVIEALYNGESRYGELVVEFIGRNGDVKNKIGRFAYSIKTEPQPSKNKDESEYDWEFIFLNKRLKDELLKELDNKIKSVLNEKGYSSVIDLLRTDGGINKIAKVYKEVFKNSRLNLNITSTILLHRPAKNIAFIDKYCGSKCVYEKEMHYFPCGICCKCRKIAYEKERPLTLLTGDAEFDNYLRTKVDKELKKSSWKMLQVPHHGSKSNWNKLCSLKEQFDEYVIPYGLGNRHKHPNSEVVSDIQLKYKKCVTEVTQSKRLDYFIHIC